MSILSTILLVVLIISGIIILIKNRKIATEAEEFVFSTDISWSKSLKHNLIMFFGSAAVLLLPLLSAQKPKIDDVFQAFILFLGIYYLKTLYLQEK